MISAEDLNRCIDNLADLSANASQLDKRKLLEIGYILKTELDTVNAWNKSVSKERDMRGIDVKKLLEDNTQLFNENKKLQEILAKMKSVIEDRIPRVESQINNVNEKVNNFQDFIRKIQ
jgi:regulator of replication initiation timing